MRALGLGAVGSVSEVVEADTVRYCVIPEVPAGYVPAISAYVDGLGGGSGVALARPVLWSGDPSTVLAVGGEVAIATGDEAGWVQFPLYEEYPGGVPLPEGEYVVLGLHFGGATEVARLYGETGGGAVLATPYDDPLPDALAGAVEDMLPSFVAPYVTDWTPPPAAELAWYARLPFDEAQRFLGATGPTDKHRAMTCGWHGASFDKEQGSFALVRTGGPLDALVGEKIAVRYGQHVVYAYVNGGADVIEDLSLTRRLFQELAPLATYELSVGVEVLD